MASTVKKLKQVSGVFAVVAGTRISGKTTSLGTLPGSTLLLQAELLETGSNSAGKLARRNGGQLEIETFTSVADLMDKLQVAGKSGKYDNIAVDSISAVTTMKYNEPEIQAQVKKDNWGAFRAIAQSMQDFMLSLKKLTITDGINAFMTLGLKAKFDAVGNIIDLEPELKGNATLSFIQSLCPTVVYTRVLIGEDGKPIRELITAPDGVFNGRIDNLLDDENPGVISLSDGGLAKVIELAKGE